MIMKKAKWITMHLHLVLSCLHGILSPSAGSVLQIFCGLSHLSQTEIKRNHKLLILHAILVIFLTCLKISINFQFYSVTGVYESSYTKERKGCILLSLFLL